ASPEINAMQGIYTAAEPGTDLFTAYQNDYYHFYYSRISRADTMIASTFCFAIRRERFLAHGGFDESVSEPTVEDEEFGYRLAGQGCLVRLNKQLAVTHLAHYDAVSFTHRKIRMTRSQMSAMCRRKLDKLVTSVTNLCPGMTHHHLPVLLSLPLTPLLLLSVLLLPFGPPPALLAFVLSAAAFTAVNVDFWAFFIRRHGVSRLPALVLVTIYDRVLILVGFTLGLAEFCRRGKR
ncbi:hypothetical protein JW905_11875, partial [bacterium]|nr:hypothetical protein [candidate division CSSED10-310 bacterium]